MEALRATLDGQAALARAARASATASAASTSGLSADGARSAGGGGGVGGRRGPTKVGFRARERARARAAAPTAATDGRNCGSADVWTAPGCGGSDGEGGGDRFEASSGADAGWESDGALVTKRRAARGRHWEGVLRYVTAAGARWRAHDRAAERYKDVPRTLGWCGG
jgi:hypothetical protein